MCCGTAQNTYHTLAGLRLVLADGTRLDSEDPASVAAFEQPRQLLDELARLGRETRANTELADRIRHKYRLKNTTGLSLNALVDYDQPLDILQHLLVRRHPRLHQRRHLRHRARPPAQGQRPAGVPHRGKLLPRRDRAQAPAGLGRGTARPPQPALGAEMPGMPLWVKACRTTPAPC
jgi:D-lactate dehydrogenase